MSKIGPDHLARQAVIYIRQSTAGQVAHNVESKRRQYGLAERARHLGWTDVQVIDDDLGRARRHRLERIDALVVRPLHLRWRQAVEHVQRDACVGEHLGVFALDTAGQLAVSRPRDTFLGIEEVVAHHIAVGAARDAPLAVPVLVHVVVGN